MIEEAVILVEIDEQHGARPDGGVGGQRLDHLGGIGRALRRAGGAGMFRSFRRAHHPADLRQAVGQHIGAQRVKRAGAQPLSASTLRDPASPR
jgi:hypothetical protein